MLRQAPGPSLFAAFRPPTGRQILTLEFLDTSALNDRALQTIDLLWSKTILTRKLFINNNGSSGFSVGVIGRIGRGPRPAVWGDKTAAPARRSPLACQPARPSLPILPRLPRKIEAESIGKGRVPDMSSPSGWPEGPNRIGRADTGKTRVAHKNVG